jgi:hypothetical protein
MLSIDLAMRAACFVKHGISHTNDDGTDADDKTSAD